MAKAFPNAGRPSPGSLLANWLERLQPPRDSFTCGVRVIDGSVPAQSSRWSYRRSWVDPLKLDGVIILNHGTKNTLRMRVEANPFRNGAQASARPGTMVIAATLADGSAKLELAIPLDKGECFGLPEPH